MIEDIVKKMISDQTRQQPIRDFADPWVPVADTQYSWRYNNNPWAHLPIFGRINSKGEYKTNYSMCHSEVLGMLKPGDICYNIYQCSCVPDDVADRFLELMIGDESPWIEFKSWMFPDTERLVRIGDDQYSINSWFFRRHYGFVWDYDDIADQSYRAWIVWLKCLRWIQEHPAQAKFWDMLCLGGVHPRLALALMSMYRCSTDFGKVYLSGEYTIPATHSFFDGQDSDLFVHNFYNRVTDKTEDSIQRTVSHQGCDQLFKKYNQNAMSKVSMVAILERGDVEVKVVERSWRPPIRMITVKQFIENAKELQSKL